MSKSKHEIDVENPLINPADYLFDIASSFDKAVLEMPEMRESVKKLLLVKKNIEADFIKMDGSIDLDALREHFDLKERIKLYLKAFVSDTLSYKIVDIVNERNPSIGSSLLKSTPNIESYAQDELQRGIAKVYPHNNIVVPESMYRINQIARFFEFLSDSFEKESEVAVPEIKLWPFVRGATFVVSEKEMKSLMQYTGGLTAKKFIESAGLSVSFYSPNERAVLESVGEDEISFVYLPSSLPKINGKVDLSFIDNFLTLYERGNTVWHRHDILAAVFVRKGFSVEKAISLAGLVPSGIDPEQQESFKALIADLKTIPKA